MINGAHCIIYSKDAEADRAFLRDVLKLDHVDAGGGWLIFALPPTELAVHPIEGEGFHELYLICDDIEGFVDEMEGLGVACSPVSQQSWGRLVQVSLPGGGRIGVYEASHTRP